jgi:hypothetical protein
MWGTDTKIPALSLAQNKTMINLTILAKKNMRGWMHTVTYLVMIQQQTAHTHTRN